MTRPVIAIVTGFTRNEDLCRRSLASLRKLKRRGVIDRVLYVTWDTPALDTFVTPVLDMPEVETVRLPEPQPDGAPYRKGTIYQIRNLEAALALVPEEHALVFKTRPDFVANTEFLAEKITNFENLCAPSDLQHSIDVPTPPSPFKAKIWVPWADSNQPFFYEDGAFMGLKCDVAKLADRQAETHLDILEDKIFGWFAHVVRFVMPFLPDNPIFERYVREFACFPNNLEFRMAMLKIMGDDPFFWHLVIAHAWIMATSFHVDCGHPGQLSLYTNIYNADADWTRADTLKVNPPYDDVQNWRQGQMPGGVLPGAGRVYGRLMDDSWAHALFSRPVLNDLTPENLRGVLHNVSLYRMGVLQETEDAFYAKLADLRRAHQLAA